MEHLKRFNLHEAAHIDASRLSGGSRRSWPSRWPCFIVSFFAVVISILVLDVRVSVLGSLLMLLILLVSTVCMNAIGFIAANLSRNESNVNMISNLMCFPMLFTSEAFYSLQHALTWVKIAGHLQPFYYFVEAMRSAAKPVVQLGDVLLPLAVLTGFTLVCLLIAVLTFRWDTDGIMLYKGGKSISVRPPSI